MDKTLVDKHAERIMEITKKMKRWRNLHPTRKFYAIRTGKRSAEKLTNSLKIWWPRMSRGTEGKWSSQEDMDTEKKVHGIFRIRKMALMTVRKKIAVSGWILQKDQE